MTVRISGVATDPFDNPAVIDPGESHALGILVITKPYDELCPAELVLQVEGLSYAVLTVEPSTKYSQQPEQYAGVLATLWQHGDEFINLEYDVAPWPGALKELHECPEPLCCFPYPTWPIGQRVIGIGCMKFGLDLVKALPNVWENWGNVPWWDLDGALVSDLKTAGYTPHIHSPAVAHVRRPLLVQ